MQFVQRVDELFKVRPDLFGGKADAERVKGVYAFISNFLMHGGVGVIDYYLTEEADGSLSVCPVPELAMGTLEALDVACNFIERLADLLDVP